MKAPVMVLAAGAAIAVPATAQDHGHAKHVARWRCPKRFTVRMGERAAQVVYRGTRDPSRRNMRLLGRIEMCQRNLAARSFMRWFDRHQAALHTQRVYDATHPFAGAVATFFDDSGATASGEHFTYGFASCGSEGVGCVPFGTRVEFCWQRRCIVGQREDSGPYGAGRDFDLNTAMAGALGMTDAGVVGLTWRYA